MMHRIVDDRLICLQKEKECLLSAAQINMSAVLAKEVQFSDDTSKPHSSDVVVLDAAPASYLLGELFRRGGDAAAASAWFDTADKILKHQLALPDKANSRSHISEEKLDDKAISEKHARLLTLQKWIQEQHALVKPTDLILDSHVTDAISYVLRSCAIAGGKE
jgi:hypothetical protein